MPFEGDYYDLFLDWSADGSRIVFGHGSSIFAIDDDGSDLRQITDVNPGNDLYYGYHADLSPSQERIVYSTCSEQTEPPRGWGIQRLPDEFSMYPEGRGGWFYEHGRRDYEIVSANIDGGDKRRLTENIHLDHYPAWSPDGTRIAFISSPLEPYALLSQRSRRSGGLGSGGLRTQLHTMAADGSDLRLLTPFLDDLHLYPPVWSPDGSRIAFVVNEHEESDLSRWRSGLYTVRDDGTGLARVSDVVGVPSWSPDGTRLAFARLLGEESGVYTANPDGTGVRMLIHVSPENLVRKVPYEPTSVMVQWSPDGAEILFVDGGVRVVGADGSGLRKISSGNVVGAAWSPDSTRIAVHILDRGNLLNYGSGLHISRGSIRTVARDGTDPLTLVRWEEQYSDVLPPRLLPRQPDSLVSTPDPESCNSGIAIPEADSNPDLVRDCRVLLSIRDTLTGDTFLNWMHDIPMDDWDGVTVGGSPLRVRRLDLVERPLYGGIPPEIGDLEGLEVIDLRWTTIGGEIPAELGRLTGLRRLDLGGNWFSGPIPPELGSLTGLELLDLGGNHLSGTIPVEMSRLTNLYTLVLGGNKLTGPIPPELGDLVGLRYLALWGNQLTGTVPVELGRLTNLVVFAMDFTQWELGVPDEVLDLPNLAFIPTPFGDLREEEP